VISLVENREVEIPRTKWCEPFLLLVYCFRVIIIIIISTDAIETADQVAFQVLDSSLNNLKSILNGFCLEIKSFAQMKLFSTLVRLIWEDSRLLFLLETYVRIGWGNDRISDR
jgi:hypothetical protein